MKYHPACRDVVIRLTRRLWRMSTKKMRVFDHPDHFFCHSLSQLNTNISFVILRNVAGRNDEYLSFDKFLQADLDLHSTI